MYNLLIGACIFDCSCRVCPAHEAHRTVNFDYVKVFNILSCIIVGNQEQKLQAKIHSINYKKLG